MANFCCAIEMEPRTLNQGQLHHAREAAVDIVQNKEPDEASTIFTEGLTPVVTVKDTTVMMLKGKANEPQRKEEEGEEEKQKQKQSTRTEISCQCTCTTAVIEIEASPDQSTFIKEPLSAPF